MLAGPLRKLKSRNNNPVSYERAFKYHNSTYRIWTRLVSYGAGLLSLCFTVILFHPSHWVNNIEPQSNTKLFSWIMLACLGLLQLFTILITISAIRATLRAKDPVPVRAKSKLKVSFVTTRAPGEPIDMVRVTLSAIKKVRYKQGSVDVWLLDETKDIALMKMCKDLGVNYFSRKGIERWNTPPNYPLRLRILGKINKLIKPHSERTTDKYLVNNNRFFAAKSKHGNFNSWIDSLKDKAINYDILAGVDTDHVPKVNYLERLLGYFRDEDVAYVVGPQVYGNYNPGLSGLVARWSESQASFFQSTIQRAANTSNAAMFVGTNYAVRMDVIEQIGGIQPCITEDMATGLSVHSSKNPKTGNKWKSVYTPDVLAVGEGPEYWGPYFTQQWRWAAGAFDTWKRTVWKVFFKLPRKSMLHYFLILMYYPLTALSWLLAVVSSMVYLVTGSTAILAPWNEFVSLYMMNLIMQLSLYFWNRNLNISPHEPHGSLGFPGIAISTISAPIYLSALTGILFGKKPNFQVTTKGASENPDGFSTFKIQLRWAAIIIAGIIYGTTQGHTNLAMLVWTAMLLAICFIPIILGMSLALPARFKNYIQIRRTENV
jgi:cellulose synthase/poly-beta-1,6-N-acetylglucosamine synthase-like glycosyltransferase